MSTLATRYAVVTVNAANHAHAWRNIDIATYLSAYPHWR